MSVEFATLLDIVGEEPLFETAILLAGRVEPSDVRRQLSRWVASGKVIQLRRGLYALGPPYRKVRPHPFLTANRLVPPSYVSGPSALAFHGLIPEFVPVTLSVTTGRPGRRSTPLGPFAFQHIRTPFFFGSRLVELGGGQRAMVATPEKALLDTIHLTPGGASGGALRELRLQHLDRLDLATLRAFAERARSPKLSRAVRVVTSLAREEAEAEAPP